MTPQDGGVKAEHLPVMPEEALEGLNIKPEGIYCDCTLGGGGHTLKIHARLTGGKVVGIDRDPAALEAVRAKAGDVEGLALLRGDFRNLAVLWDSTGYGPADGFLYDLGISSVQLASAGMGISFQTDGPLDMRMDSDESVQTAAEYIESADERELAELFWKYGENAGRRIARRIVSEREKGRIETVERLAKIVSAASGGGSWKRHPATKVFLALRANVNREQEAISETLPAAIERLKPGGRIVVITYHSLEDGLVKNIFRRAAKGCSCERPPDECECNGSPAIRLINKKVLTPSEDEIRKNSRSRSAKMRIAERV